MTGIEFEKLVKSFFRSIFEEMGYHVFEVRNQNSGTQNGFDIKIDFVDRNHQRRNIFIECKHYTTRLEWSQILRKQIELNNESYNVDAFILLSPLVDLSNIDDNLQGEVIEKWFDFPVEFITPNKGVKEILALQPSIYEKVYTEKYQGDYNRSYYLNQFKELIEYLLAFHKHSIPPKKQYPPVDYIHRKVRAVYSKDVFRSPIYLTDLIKEQLSAETENNNNKIVVLGVAGFGKSVELDYLANYFSNYSESKDLFPVKIRLNTITDGAIEELLLMEESNFEKIPEENLLVIMDGLDEIHEQFIDSVSSKIINFSRKYSKSIIVVSCRNNFYITESKSQTAKLEGFKSYDIESLDDSSIYSYIKEKIGEEQGTLLVDKLGEKGYYNLLTSPFILINIVAYYIEKGTIPESQHQVYEHLISIRIENDFNKYVNSGVKLNFASKKIKKVIQQLAIIVGCLGRNYLEEEELQEIIPDEDFYKKITRTFLFNKNNGSDFWEFEHSNFKEYLAAKYLSELDFDKVINLITFPEINKIKPIWFNTILFLLSILEKDTELFLLLKNWLIENEPDILIRCEKDKLSLDVREQVFLQIVTEYEEAQTFIRSPKFNKQSLVLFVEDSVSLIDILLGKINSIDNELFTSEILELLPHFTHVNNFYEEIRSVLLNEICNPLVEEKAKYNLLNCLSELGISDGEMTTFIIETNDLYSSIYIRVGFYKYLEKSTFIDNYVELLIDGVELIHNKDTWLFYDNIFQEEKSILELLLEKIESVEALQLLFVHVLKVIDYEKLEGYYSDVIKILLVQAVKKYINGVEMFFELVLELLIKTFTEYARLSYELRTFFVETKTELKAFKILYDQYELEQRTPLGIVCNEETVYFLIEEVINKRISKQKIFLLRTTISWDAPHEIYNLLQSELLKINPRKFHVTKEESKEDLDRRKKQKDIELLLNRDLFLAEVENVFKSESDNNELTFKQVYDTNLNSFNDRKMNNQLVAKTIRQFVKNEKNVSVSQIFDLVNTPIRWEWFVLHRFMEYDTESKIFDFDERSCDFLKIWVFNNIEKANFKTGISIKEGKYYYNYLETYLSYFIQRFDIDLHEDILLELTHVDYFLPQKVNEKTRTYDFLLNKVGEEKLKNYVLRNIATLELLPAVKQTHFQFALQLNLSESVPYIFDELIKLKDYKEYELNRLIVQFLELGGDKNQLLDVIGIFSEEVQLFIIDNLINQDYNVVKDIIQKKIEVDGNETYIHLLARNHMNNGFLYLKEWILRNKKLPDNHIDYDSLDNKYLSGLIEIFDDCMVNDCGTGEWTNRSHLLSPMIELASNNEQDFCTLRAQLKNWLERYPIMKHLNDNIRYLENKYYSKKQQSMSFSDALKWSQ